MKKLATYRKALHDLIKECKQAGIRVKFVPDYKTRDYLGMNPLAAKAMGFNNCNGKTVLIDNQMNYKDKYIVLKHELDEWTMMRKHGMEYWQAHDIALDLESHPARKAMIPYELKKA